MEQWDYLRKFRAGVLSEAWRYLGAHPETQDGEAGWCFRVWAPRAGAVSVVGPFNHWTPGAWPLVNREGIWEGFFPGLKTFDAYQFAITGPDGVTRVKTDPYAFYTALRPETAGRLYHDRFPWKDAGFPRIGGPDAPLNIYEVHLGSWRRKADGRFLNYREAAVALAAYVKDLGFNAVELLPITEHPLDGSWGYQCSGYFAPTSRYGTPEDLKWFVDHLHRNGLAVILDWVPAHFCKDPHGLGDFDGTSCYEPSDPKQREHLGWGTRVFDYEKGEVRSFLLSSARFWLEEFHMDGLRVDAVASMLYLDYDRDSGQWTPNASGGRENTAAIRFLQDLNTMAHELDPAIIMIAEESSVFPGVTAPVEQGGLGFTYKWNMGWMNDICRYLKTPPSLRPAQHNDITFSLTYAFSERYVLPLSHDEVVHGKGSLAGKLPPQARLSSLRGFYAYSLAHPGKKLTFMGGELGTLREWDFDRPLDWPNPENEEAQQLQRFFRDINGFYLKEPSLWELDDSWDGFEWLVSDDRENSTAAFLRKDRAGRSLLCAVNFSPRDLEAYPIGVPHSGRWTPAFSTDRSAYGGRDFCDTAPVAAKAVPRQGRPYSIHIRIPAFGAVFLRREEEL